MKIQACGHTLETVPPQKVVGKIFIDVGQVVLEYFPFIRVCDEFETRCHVQAAIMISVSIYPFFLDLLLVTVSEINELLWSFGNFNPSSL